MRNIGWLYYRDYFDPKTLATQKKKALEDNANLPYNERKDETVLIKETEASFYQSKHDAIYQVKLSATALASMRMELTNISFTLVTTYPGLLAGTGQVHDLSEVGVAKLGFSFDHSTGLPVIPGSSVKGRLRSFFSGRVYQKALELMAKKGTQEEQEKARKRGQQLLRKAPLMEKYMRYVWQEELKLGELSPEDLLRLEWALFEGVTLDKITIADEGIPNFKNMTETALFGPQLSLFFDAFPVKSDNENGQFMGEDTITPHRHRNRALKEWDVVSNPVPILFMKVLPNVHWEFGFRLPDIEVREGLVFKSDQLQKLFMYLLTEHGAGAKTSVGYGQFKEPENAAEKYRKEKLDEKKFLKTNEGWYFIGKLGKGDVIEARCIGKKHASPKIKRFSLLLGSPESAKPEIELSYADDDILNMSCLLTIKTVFKAGKLKGKVESVELKTLLR